MNDLILIKYLLKETSTEENLLVERWLGTHPDHQKQYEQLQWVWKESKANLLSSTVDENLAWEKFKARSGRTSKRVQFPVWLKGVAAVVAILMTGWVALSIMPHSGRAYYGEVILEAEDNSREEKLLDGTVVTLNKNSRLSYSQKMFGGERHAHLLEGEAYFKVERDENKPFIIQVDNLTVRVLGTSFNVKKQGEYTDVILDEGFVSVKLGDQAMVLEPGQKVSANGTDKVLKKSPVDNNLYRYYLNNKFEAANIPLQQIIEALNDAYDAKISIASEELKSRRITTTLEYGALDQNLSVIQETLGISISGNGKERVLH
ncbi:MAG TPA: FecR domain-containing protein [Cyclobacteriaceae bacterium]|nr:FecR domain-containing protein [Cyclobacteriaceae bacterium]